MRRLDFTSLMLFTRAPWKDVHFTEAQYPLLLDVAMRRGGSEVAQDFAQLGIKVTPIFDVVSERGAKDGALVVARIQPVSSKRASDGYHSVVRLFDYVSGGKVLRPTGRFGTPRVGESRDVEPLGVTAEVRSPGALPVGRRIEIIGRYRESRTRSLQTEQESELADLGAGGVDPSKLIDVREDPPPTIALQLVAMETKPAGP